MTKSNFYLFTGPPGAGKTTLLEALAQNNQAVMPEVARAIIRQQQATGGNATHTGDRLTYSHLMLMASITDYLNCDVETQPVFFDRGIPDLYSYTKRFCGGVTSEVLEAVQHYRYNTKAFLFPVWPEIYCHDTERKQSLEEAIETYHAVKEGYSACGYTLIEVPKMSVSERVDFILQTITAQ